MEIKILIGGSPCTFWSIAQSSDKRETTAEGVGWELFKNYLIAKEKFKPDFFLYENNKSAAQAIKQQIAEELGVGTDTNARLTYINSALVSAQNRQRFYVTNFGDIEQPQDRGIVLRDILESGEDLMSIEKSLSSMVATPLNTTGNGKAQCLRASCYKDGIRNMVANGTDRRTCVAERVGIMPNKTHPVYEVKDGQITIKDKQYPIKLSDGYYTIRKLTVTECCRLQTMPDDYCKAVSKSQAYKGLGNGWTAEVIIHLLNHALKDVDRNTPIKVLSMYDGIGTGRYCLDKMGFNNVEYHAYEIDKYAMAIANDNYPDIIQQGDAFDVRQEEWTWVTSIR